MKGKSLKKLVVMIMVLSFLAMTSATAFAQSAGRGDNFSILENIPNAQAVQLSDAEMKEVKGSLTGAEARSAIVQFFVKGAAVKVAGTIIGNVGFTGTAAEINTVLASIHSAATAAGYAIPTVSTTGAALGTAAVGAVVALWYDAGQYSVPYVFEIYYETYRIHDEQRSQGTCCRSRSEDINQAMLNVQVPDMSKSYTFYAVDWAINKVYHP